MNLNISHVILLLVLGTVGAAASAIRPRFNKREHSAHVQIVILRRAQWLVNLAPRKRLDSSVAVPVKDAVRKQQ